VMIRASIKRSSKYTEVSAFSIFDLSFVIDRMAVWQRTMTNDK